jgi:prepilin peptidase CpaA
MQTIAIMLLLGAWALVLGVHDQLRGRLPNLWLAPALIFAIMWMLVFGESPTSVGIAHAWMGFGVAFALLLPGYALRQVGAGDVKFLAVMGLFLGPAGVLVVIILGYAVVIGARWLALLVDYYGWQFHAPAPGASETRMLSGVRAPLGLGLAFGFIVQLQDPLGLAAAIGQAG